MRQTNHIILDFEKPKPYNSSIYWANNFLRKKEQPLFMSNTHLNSIYLNTSSNLKTRYSSSFFHKSRKFTINDISSIDQNLINTETNLFKPVEPLKRKDIKRYYLTYSESKGRRSFLIKNFGLRNFYIDNIKKILINSSKINTNSATNHFRNLINTNFLRKERIYTKLKYSRTPGYDIVSGGAAVILAGFLGFLVSEKYGIELPDSGDFYYLWMYGVFIAFSVRPLLTFASKTQSVLSLFSLRHILVFYTTILNLLLKMCKNNIFK